MIDVMCLTIRNYWLSGHFVTISSPFVLSGFYGKTHKFRSLPWSDTFHCYKGINVDTIHFRIIKQKVYDIYIQYFACNCFLKELLSPLLRKQTSSRKQMKQDHLFCQKFNSAVFSVVLVFFLSYAKMPNFVISWIEVTEWHCKIFFK